MISSIGDRRSTAWDNAPGPSTITRTDALAAVNDGRSALDEGFFRAKLINKDSSTRPSTAKSPTQYQEWPTSYADN